MEEEWRPIKGFGHSYGISNKGRVVSLEEPMLLEPSIARGYKQVTLYDSGDKKRFKIHRLVAEHFIPNPDNKPIVNHIDGDKKNNNVENLEWMSISENANHSYYELGHGNIKPIEQYSLDGELIKEYPSRSAAVRETGINRSNIASNLAGRTKTAGGYIWKYKQLDK